MHVQNYFHPDLGWDRRAPQLDAITEYAGRSAGSFRWVVGCSGSDLQWCRKRFLDAYKLAQESGKVEHLVTRKEARNILRSLTAEPPIRKLPRSLRPPATPEPDQDRETIRDLNDVFKKTNAQPPTLATLPDEEYEQRKAHLKEQAEQIKRQHKDLNAAKAAGRKKG